MDAGDDVIERGEKVVRKVEGAVLEDVALGAGEEVERAVREVADAGDLVGEALRIEAARLEGEVGDVVLDRTLLPAIRGLERLSLLAHRFQMGLTQQYVLYILVALALLSLTLLPFDKLIAFLGTN